MITISKCKDKNFLRLNFIIYENITMYIYTYIYIQSVYKIIDNFTNILIIKNFHKIYLFVLREEIDFNKEKWGRKNGGGRKERESLTGAI